MSKSVVRETTKTSASLVSHPKFFMRLIRNLLLVLVVFITTSFSVHAETKWLECCALSNKRIKANTNAPAIMNWNIKYSTTIDKFNNTDLSKLTVQIWWASSARYKLSGYTEYCYIEGKEIVPFRNIIDRYTEPVSDGQSLNANSPCSPIFRYATIYLEIRDFATDEFIESLRIKVLKN